MYDTSDKEAAIRAVQRFLLELHYFEGGIPFVTIDGIYGDATRAAIGAYQRLRGLPETGEADYATFRLLYADYARAYRARTGTAIIPPDTPLPVTVGASGDGVLAVQRLMNRLAERYSLTARTDESGVYSCASGITANALRRIYRLPEDGTITAEFFDTMVRDYEYPTRTG
ncbi:MAG: peptidoglycan-binding protein [Clostridia bacterium]|nr:peptidoglycan-binding protein [Clostridia bacterium]